MPMRFRIDETLGIIVTTATGSVDGADLIRHAQELLEDPSVQGLDELVDLTGHRSITVPTDTIRGVAHLLRERGLNKPGGKLALVADSDAVFGMARLYQAHRNHPDGEIGVFRERKKAIAWLGLSDDAKHRPARPGTRS